MLESLRRRDRSVKWAIAFFMLLGTATSASPPAAVSEKAALQPDKFVHLEGLERQPALGVRFAAWLHLVKSLPAAAAAASFPGEKALRLVGALLAAATRLTAQRIKRFCPAACKRLRQELLAPVKFTSRFVAL